MTGFDGTRDLGVMVLLIYAVRTKLVEIAARRRRRSLFFVGVLFVVFFYFRIDDVKTRSCHVAITVFSTAVLARTLHAHTSLT